MGLRLCVLSHPHSRRSRHHGTLHKRTSDHFERRGWSVNTPGGHTVYYPRLAFSRLLTNLYQRVPDGLLMASRPIIITLVYLTKIFSAIP